MLMIMVLIGTTPSQIGDIITSVEKVNETQAMRQKHEQEM